MYTIRQGSKVMYPVWRNIMQELHSACLLVAQEPLAPDCIKPTHRFAFPENRSHPCVPVTLLTPCSSCLQLLPQLLVHSLSKIWPPSFFLPLLEGLQLLTPMIWLPGITVMALATPFFSHRLTYYHTSQQGSVFFMVLFPQPQNVNESNNFVPNTVSSQCYAAGLVICWINKG